MAMNEDQQKKFVAIVRQLKKQKGVSIKQAGIMKDIKRFQQAQKDILQVKEEFKDNEIVVKEADKEHKKLQAVVNELNEYMKILHPEGLLDFGAGSTGQQIVGQG
jgi:hypothetical protein